MAYRDFTLIKIKEQFGITRQYINLFPNDTPEIIPSNHLLESVEIAYKMPLRNEKSRSEYLVSPILTEIKLRNQDKMQLFSGENLKADPKAGLNGEVDFLVVNVPDADEIASPIINVMEAKRGDIEPSVAQCVAQMIGARTFNQKHQDNTETIHGVVTTGTEWLFLKLEGQTIFQDLNRYGTNDLPKLLGRLQLIINFYQ